MDAEGLIKFHLPASEKDLLTHSQSRLYANEIRSDSMKLPKKPYPIVFVYFYLGPSEPDVAPESTGRDQKEAGEKPPKTIHKNG
ncbi:MAG: hypothetical protein ABW148_06650 [Sedimenticola sp.]